MRCATAGASPRALVALIVASAATLVVPFAVRRMIDYGFSGGQSALIHVYFAALIGVVGVLALASGARYYFVMTLGERVVADLRGDLFAPSDPRSTRASSTRKRPARSSRASPPTRRS